MREVRHEQGHIWQRTSVVDEEAIDHERVLSLVDAVGETIEVRVAQRKDFDLVADPVTVEISPPRVTVGKCFEMSGQQAIELSDALREAGRFAQSIDRDERQSPLVSVIAIDRHARRPKLVGES